MTERATLNMTTDDLDNLYRLSSAQRELSDIAGSLFHGKTSKRGERLDFSNRLYRVLSSLKTVEMRLGAYDQEEQ